MDKALFLDRDGVINHMVLYKTGWDSPQKPEDVALIAGIEKIISWANKNKISIIEVSNQPGVAKGKMSQKTSDAIENKVHQLLKENGTFINKVYICPHHPAAVIAKLRKKCNCRKPKPGLLLKAAKELGIDLTKSVFLGDKAADAIAGKKAGCKTIIYIHHHDSKNKVEEAKNADADFKVTKMPEVTQILRKLY
jgi:D-glycero-D-manno-heptose 1,7-bisphosphate phosphatase